jgi:hypothetical protein
MSYRKQSRVSPYCATCDKAGQPESVYRGHFTKDAPGGKVVCPTIKGFKCRECGESGHIANEKYCPVLREYAAADRQVSQARERAERVLRDQQEKDKKKESDLKKRISTNKFAAAFGCDSDDDDDVVVKKAVAVKEEFPAIVPAATAATAAAPLYAISYKSMLDKPIALNKEEVVAMNFRVITAKLPAKMKRCWADDDSSSDEEDD